MPSGENVQYCGQEMKGKYHDARKEGPPAAAVIVVGRHLPHQYDEIQRIILVTSLTVQQRRKPTHLVPCLNTGAVDLPTCGALSTEHLFIPEHCTLRRVQWLHCSRLGLIGRRRILGPHFFRGIYFSTLVREQRATDHVQLRILRQ